MNLSKADDCYCNYPNELLLIKLKLFFKFDTNNKFSRQKIILFLELNRKYFNKVQYIDFHY